MRTLTESETTFVSGGSGEVTLIGGTGEVTPPCTQKNNNGYGNGAESGPPPGHSGGHNPQLITDNSGPRGPR